MTPEFTCIVADYPDVSVAIPWNSLPTVEDFYVTLKVTLASVKSVYDRVLQCSKHGH